MNKIYRFKGAEFSGKRAQKYGERLDYLAQQKKTELKNLETKDIVEDARPEESPLHDVFEWDDSIAAEEYRKSQASRLLNNLEIQISENFIEPIWVEPFISFNDEVGYTPIVEVLSDSDKKERFLAQALEEADSWANRYRRYTELSEIFVSIEKAKKELLSKKNKIVA